MERIQQAIAKARKQRNKFPDTKNTIRQRSYQITSDTNYEYTATRSIEFDDYYLKERKIVGGLAHDEQSEPYRQLRSQILQKMRSNNWKTLAITSPRAGNGKTLTAINLAIALSQEVNQTVLLVDLNLRKPSVMQTFGIDCELGITDYIEDSCQLSQILINPGYRRLVVLPGVKQTNFTSELLTSPKMKTLLAEITHRYEDRIIIFDLPPLLESDDALVFAPTLDATLLILEDGGSSKYDIERSIKLLEPATLIGTVINHMK